MKATRVLPFAVRAVAFWLRPAVLTLTLCIVAPLSAWPQSTTVARATTPASGGPSSRFEFLPTLRTVQHSNFFQASSDREQEDVRQDEAKIRIRYLIKEDRRLRVYGELGVSQYDSARLDNAPKRRIGLMSGGPRHAFDSSIAFVSNGREVELTDSVRASDIWSWVGAYDYWLTDAWQVGVRAGFWQQAFDDGSADIDTSDAAFRVRYRGFGRAFSPEVGYQQRQSSDGAGKNDYEEDLNYIRLHFKPSTKVGFSVRYRFRDRSFSTQDPNVSNFERRDDRDKWTLAFSAQVRKKLNLRLTYDRIDGRSTHATYIFDSQDLGLALTWRLGGT